MESIILSKSDARLMLDLIQNFRLSYEWSLYGTPTEEQICVLDDTANAIAILETALAP